MSYVQIAKLDISCSRHQQYAWTLVRQLDIGKTQQITFAQVVMFLVHNAQVLSTLNAPLALQVMFCSHRQPHVLRRAPQAQVLTVVTIVSISLTTPHVSLIALQGIIQIQPITNAMKVMKVYPFSFKCFINLLRMPDRSMETSANGQHICSNSFSYINSSASCSSGNRSGIARKSSCYRRHK